MEIRLTAKIAAFCRELGDESDEGLRAIARGQDMESVFVHAEGLLQAGRTGPELEADLDSLDVMVRLVEGHRLYPTATRGYLPLPGAEGGTGAQWWTCPRNRCRGRGRVRPGQEPPLCGATGEQLNQGPLPE